MSVSISCSNLLSDANTHKEIFITEVKLNIQVGMMILLMEAGYLVCSIYPKRTQWTLKRVVMVTGTEGIHSSRIWAPSHQG